MAGGASTPANGTPVSLPGLVEVEQYDKTADNGTAGSFVPDDGSSATEIVYNEPQVRPINGSEDSSYVPTKGGQWMNYTVNISSSGSYTFEARVASPYDWNSFHVQVDGVNRTGSLYIPNTGSWDAYQFVTLDDIWLDAGQHVVTLVAEGDANAKANFDYFRFNPYIAPPTCDPSWWETRDCQYYGGWWDFDQCACQYGYYYNY